MSKIKSCYNCQWATEHPPLPPSHLGPSEPGYFVCDFSDGPISMGELDQEIGEGIFDCLNWELSFEEADVDDLEADDGVEQELLAMEDYAQRQEERGQDDFYHEEIPF